MEENEKKDLEETVEKIINRNEEKKRASMRKDPGTPIKEKHLVKKASSPEKKKKHVGTAILVIIIAGLLTYMAWCEYGPLPEVEPEIVIVYPANVVLASFDDGYDGFPIPLNIPGRPITTIDDYAGVTFKLKNTGDEVAVDVSCFIKCCDQDGAILFAQMFTFDDIGPGSSSGSIFPGQVSIPATGYYKVPISDETVYVTHNIEIQWSPQGVNTYTKLTEV